jgi:hypothetical protein
VRPEINYGNYVLLRFDGFVRVPYKVITQEHWKKWERQHGHKAVALFWQEVARGTRAEMEALGKLMPEPKTLGFD